MDQDQTQTIFDQDATRTPWRPLVLLALFLLMPLQAKAKHLETYPDLDESKAKPVLVVARVAPGRMLPEFEACRGRKVICLHSPLWFRARVLRSVYGAAPGQTLEVATTSHYGMSGYEESDGPRLILLFVEDGKIVMPTYAEADLETRDDGQVFLIQSYGAEPSWLPCSIWSVKEEVSPKRFPGLEGVPKDAYEWRYVTEDPESFIVTHDRAFPRFGISLEALEAHLAHVRPGAKEFACDREASSRSSDARSGVR